MRARTAAPPGIMRPLELKQEAALSHRLITPKELPEKTGITYHLNHLRRMWNQGLFPRPIQISPNRIAWPEKAIDDWIASKIEESQKGAA